jgi:hypothetical protein
MISAKTANRAALFAQLDRHKEFDRTGFQFKVGRKGGGLVEFHLHFTQIDTPMSSPWTQVTTETAEESLTELQGWLKEWEQTLN